MKRTTALYCFATAVAVSLAACSGSSQSPLSPSSVSDSDTAANADGSTLKVTAPALLSPLDGVELDTLSPTFTFANATGRFSAASMGYRLELLDASGSVVDSRNIPSGDGVTQYTLDTNLPYEVSYQWRVRAELEGQAGPFSAMGSFRTPDQASVGSGTPSGPSSGPVGGTRTIGLNEAFGIIVNIHDSLRWHLGSGSSRGSRVDFINAAVAAIHYGHPRFNPGGGDTGWCVKDAGGGRPQSDDVIARCGSREAWDLIGGAGANGYRFHQDFLGRLPGGQNIFPPPQSALGLLNR